MPSKKKQPAAKPESKPPSIYEALQMLGDNPLAVIRKSGVKGSWSGRAATNCLLARWLQKTCGDPMVHVGVGLAWSFSAGCLTNWPLSDAVKKVVEAFDRGQLKDLEEVA